MLICPKCGSSSYEKTGVETKCLHCGTVIEKFDTGPKRRLAKPASEPLLKSVIRMINTSTKPLKESVNKEQSLIPMPGNLRCLVKDMVREYKDSPVKQFDNAMWDLFTGEMERNPVSTVSALVNISLPFHEEQLMDSFIEMVVVEILMDIPELEYIGDDTWHLKEK